MEYLNVSVIQLNVKVNDYAQNLNRALEMIDKCVEAGSKLICLPEAFATSLNLPKLKELAQSDDGEICNHLSEKSKKYGVYIVAGFVEKANDQIYSSAVLINPMGIVQAKYRRRFIYDLEKHFVQSGNEFCVIETEIGRIGIIIGYDVNFPEASRKLFNEKAEIIICPAQIPLIYSNSTRHLAIARATENTCYFILASSCGQNTIARLTYMGGSLIAQSPVGLETYSTAYTKQNDILVSCGTDEEIIHTKLNMTKIRREQIENPHYVDFINFQ